MAKEPAGLRRWRLAHRKHKRRHVVHTMARRRRYRYARKGHGRRGSRALPLVQTAILAYPAITSYKSVGFSAGLPANLVYQYTGIDANAGKWTDPQKGISLAIALLATTLIGGRIASKVGANRLMKKATGGMLKLM